MENQKIENTNENESVFKDVSSDDLMERYKELAEKYKMLSVDLKEFLEKFTNIRTEIISIEIELSARGVNIDGII